jgi:putative ABC transport system permease protein
VLGIWISSAFLGSFSNDSFSFELSIRPVTIAVAALAMILVALLSLIPGVRSVKNLDVGAVVRERAA